MAINLQRRHGISYFPIPCLKIIGLNQLPEVLASGRR